MTERELYAPRLHNIEFLRILFTFCIFACHALGAFGFKNEGRASVEIFFMLSGFFLYYTIDNQKNVQTFVLKKVIRFLPLMLFGQVVCDLISLKFRFQNYISLAFFLPSTGLTDLNYHSVGGVWYVCVLLWISVFYFYLIKTQPIKMVNLIIGIVTFVSLIVYNNWVDRIEPWLFPNSLLRGLICTGIGHFLALVYKEKKQFQPVSEKSNQKWCVKWIFTGLELWLIIYLLLTMFVSWEFKIVYTHRVSLFSIFLASFLMKKSLISQFFDDVSWAKISRYCLSFFLTHQIVIDYLYKKNEFMHDSSLCSAFLLMFFLSVCLAVFAYHFVEQPAYKYLKRFLDK